MRVGVELSSELLQLLTPKHKMFQVSLLRFKRSARAANIRILSEHQNFFRALSSGDDSLRGRVFACKTDTPMVGNIIIDNLKRRNAMTLGMYKDVPLAVAEHNSSINRVCVLTGRGKDAFGAGSDITEFPDHRMGAHAAKEYSSIEDSASESLLSIPHPVLACIHGPCFGGALNLALTADIRYCSDDATFCVPPAKLGIGYPRSLMNLLVSAVGTSNAKDLLFTAKVVDSSEALRIGLVNEVLPKEDLEEHVSQIAQKIAEKLAPMTISAAKMELIAQRYPSGTKPRLEVEEAAEKAYNNVYESEDYREGVQAFLERRDPKFLGK